MDYLAKSVTENGDFRAYLIDATELVKQAAEIHNTNQVGSVILGRALIGSLLASSSVLKGEEQMQVFINGGGPVGNIVVEADTKGEVRGYLSNPRPDFINESVGQTVGTNGFVKITKMAPYSKPFVGQVQLISGEIGDDLTYYLAQSEQIPSLLGVSVYANEDGSVERAGGFLIQTLPGTSMEAVENIEKKIGNFTPLYAQLAEGLSPEVILYNIFGGQDKVNIVENLPVKLSEELPKEYYALALSSLPVDELQQMIDEDDGAEVNTRFTNSKYWFSADELREIIKNKR
ncbi:MAG: Hsp33 family molecular chaperone HslO [Lactobacillaceae bacterium]|jgi:molecular chaperone Hsp33|nr:Hsp33 family molecular chaperone HslO [Lactobacillaceae bacterium]